MAEILKPPDTTSLTSLESPKLEHAFLFPLRMSMVAVRSCEDGLSRNNATNEAKTNLVGRRKSLSVSDIQKLDPKTSISAVPENNLRHQVAAGRIRSHSPLTGHHGGTSTTASSRGRLTPCNQGGSFGDLINSGEFKNNGSLWSVRSHSPITLSMVSIQSDQRQPSPLVGSRPPSLYDSDYFDDKSNKMKTENGNSFYKRRCFKNNIPNGDEYPKECNLNGSKYLSPCISPSKVFDHNVTIAVEPPCTQIEISNQQSAPFVYHENPDYNGQMLLYPIRNSNKKLSMKERTQHLAFLIHRQQRLCLEV